MSDRKTLALTPGSFFRWGLTHTDLVLQIGSSAQALPAAKNFAERWYIVRPIGDKLAPAIDDLVNPAIATSESEASLEAALLAKLAETPVAAAGLPRDGRWLRAALQLVQLLLPLLTG